ncbi:LxmA leader domain family RiPP [Streptomyces thermocarboxydus]
MNTTDALMAGYAAYTSADEIAAGQDGGAPEISPVSSPSPSPSPSRRTPAARASA